jgi:hypothetical protein
MKNIIAIITIICFLIISQPNQLLASNQGDDMAAGVAEVFLFGLDKGLGALGAGLDKGLGALGNKIFGAHKAASKVPLEKRDLVTKELKKKYVKGYKKQHVKVKLGDVIQNIFLSRYIVCLYNARVNDQEAAVGFLFKNMTQTHTAVGAYVGDRTFTGNELTNLRDGLHKGAAPLKESLRSAYLDQLIDIDPSP